MSKGALKELVRTSSKQFESMTSAMHFAEKKAVYGELYKRVEILGEKPIG